MVEPYADKPGDCGEGSLRPRRSGQLQSKRTGAGCRSPFTRSATAPCGRCSTAMRRRGKQNGIRDSRHRIEHIEVVHPDDIARFAELGVIASMQPPHPPGCAGVPLEPTVSRIGRDRWPVSYAWRTLKNAGAHICFASDWPVSPIDPIIGDRRRL
jgi:hypothetical protein